MVSYHAKFRLFPFVTFVPVFITDPPATSGLKILKIFGSVVIVLQLS